MKWIVVAWKEFINRKMLDQCAIVQGEGIDLPREQMKTFNAQKLKTTSDYKAFDLTQLLADKGLAITELVNEES